MYKLKTFSSKDRLDLEEVVNCWFMENQNISIKDIRYEINPVNNYQCIVILYIVDRSE